MFAAFFCGQTLNKFCMHKITSGRVWLSEIVCELHSRKKKVDVKQILTWLSGPVNTNAAIYRQTVNEFLVQCRGPTKVTQTHWHTLIICTQKHQRWADEFLSGYILLFCTHSHRQRLYCLLCSYQTLWVGEWGWRQRAPCCDPQTCICSCSHRLH